jgi:hypothetical protein
MSRRVIERDRADGRHRSPVAPRVGAIGLRLLSKLKWQRGLRLGFSPHRSYRLSGLGNAIGGQRQRRVRVARSH